jgi:hypothetical protein
MIPISKLGQKENGRFGFPKRPLEAGMKPTT